MDLNVFTLFIGFGLVSLIFSGLLHFGFGIALAVFAAAEALMTAASFWVFRSEVPAEWAPQGARVKT